MFQIFFHEKTGFYCDFIPFSSFSVLRRLNINLVPASILSERKYTLTSDTLSVSAPIRHSFVLRTSNQLKTTCDHLHECATTHIIRVVPADGPRPRTNIGCLPTELLLQIFEFTDSCAWQRDLLSFAQVCSQWSEYCMMVLFARLESSERKCHCGALTTKSMDTCALSESLRRAPNLGLAVRHFDVKEDFDSCTCRNHAHQKRSLEPLFLQKLLPILRAAKNLGSLRLSVRYPSQANALISALPNFRHLHTLSITSPFRCMAWIMKKPDIYSITTIQLAHCLARLPALTSLSIYELASDKPKGGRSSLPLPACKLTELCIDFSDLTDEDLLHLTAPSANTLKQVTLKCTEQITPDGLATFLDSISRNVTSLTLVGWPNHVSQDSHRVLDDLVERMQCLEALHIQGNNASEDMLRRRSEVFMRSGGEGIPVVRLSFRYVPKIRNCAHQEWAGWKVVQAC